MLSIKKMKFTKKVNIGIFSSIAVILLFLFSIQNFPSSQISMNKKYSSFISKKTLSPINLNFIAKIEGKTKLDHDCFTFFLSNKYSATTYSCTHTFINTMRKLEGSVDGQDYVELKSNGLMLKAVVKSENDKANFSLIFTEKFINQFVDVGFDYNSYSNETYYIPIVVENNFVYLYSINLDKTNAIINFSELPNNCEILAGSPIFTISPEGNIGIKAMVSEHHSCKLKNYISVILAKEMGKEIDYITKCVGFYRNLPGYRDNLEKCYFMHYP